MSAIIDGKLIEAPMTKRAMGGTEMMRERLLRNVDPTLLEGVAIHLSRLHSYSQDHSNVLWCHDLPSDPANHHLADNGWQKFDKIVFVSAWQRDLFLLTYGISSDICHVIQNAVEVRHDILAKSEKEIRFIYHTTPHRGLGILAPVFDKLCEEYDNLVLDVYSSFGVYGWEERDAQFEELFSYLDKHPKINNHGAVSNDIVLRALEDAHIFLYPCVWPETSCIALIEAIRSGVTAIHPNFGALPETAQGRTLMYNNRTDPQEHAKAAYWHTKAAIERKLFPTWETPRLGELLKTNDISMFKDRWESLLHELA